MDAHQTFMEHHTRCREEARAAEARLRLLTKTYGIVPEIIWVAQVACVQAVALYGSELFWDPREVGRRDDLQLLLNRQARSIVGALPTTLRGALMRESGLTPAPVTPDSRQQRFTARLANAWSCKLKVLHSNPSSGAPICRGVRYEHEHGQTTEGMNWPTASEEPAVRTTILDNTTTVNALCSAGQGRKKPKSVQGSGCGGQMDGAQMMAMWEPQQWVIVEINECRAAAFWAPDVGKSLTPNGGRSGLRLTWRSRRETHCQCMQ